MTANRLALALVCLALAALSTLLLASGSTEVQATGLLGLTVALPLLGALAFGPVRGLAMTRRAPARPRRTYTIHNYHLAR